MAFVSSVRRPTAAISPFRQSQLARADGYNTQVSGVTDILGPDGYGYSPGGPSSPLPDHYFGNQEGVGEDPATPATVRHFPRSSFSPPQQSSPFSERNQNQSYHQASFVQSPPHQHAVSRRVAQEQEMATPNKKPAPNQAQSSIFATRGFALLVLIFAVLLFWQGFGGNNNKVDDKLDAKEVRKLLSILKNETSALIVATKQDFEQSSTKSHSGLLYELGTLGEEVRELSGKLERVQGELAVERATVKALKQQLAVQDTSNWRDDARNLITEELGLHTVNIQHHIRQLMAKLQQDMQQNSADSTTDTTQTQPTTTSGLGAQAIHAIVLDHLRHFVGDAPLLQDSSMLFNMHDLTLGAEVLSEHTKYAQPPCKESSSSPLKGVVDWLSSPQVDANGPDQALTRTLKPGDCWAFCGQKATLTVQLQRASIPRFVTIEHIPSAVAHLVSSAPRQFSVVAFRDTDTALAYPLQLGEFEFEYNSTSPWHAAVFPTTRINSAVSAVQVQFKGNNGNEHTCVYRVRVFGDLGL